MKIEYKNGEMIITHPSGHVDKYQRTDIEREKVSMQDQAAKIQDGIAALDGYISKIQTSIGVM